MNNKSTTKKYLLLILLPLVLLAGCSPGGGAESTVIKAQKIIEYQDSLYDEMDASGELVDDVRVIEIKAYQFFFEPTTIVVNKGERIRLIISAEDVPHGFEIEGFEIPGYDISTQIRPGFPLELEFEADEAGVWDFICTIYCGFGHSTMKGTFVIR